MPTGIGLRYRCALTGICHDLFEFVICVYASIVTPTIVEPCTNGDKMQPTHVSEETRLILQAKGDEEWIDLELTPCDIKEAASLMTQIAKERGDAMRMIRRSVRIEEKVVGETSPNLHATPTATDPLDFIVDGQGMFEPQPYTLVGGAYDGSSIIFATGLYELPPEKIVLHLDPKQSRGATCEHYYRRPTDGADSDSITYVIQPGC